MSKAKWGEVQTRSEEEGLRFFPTIEAAMEHAEKDKTVWKISFNFKEDRVRLVRHSPLERWLGRWVYEPIILPKLVRKLEKKMREKATIANVGKDAEA